MSIYMTGIEAYQPYNKLLYTPLQKLQEHVNYIYGLGLIRCFINHLLLAQITIKDPVQDCRHGPEKEWQLLVIFC